MAGDASRHRALLLTLVVIALVPVVAAAQIFYVPTETPEQGKAFSEFNHRMAGVCLLAIGVVAAAAHLPRLGWLAKLWPFFFIVPGLYLVAMSDPEVWPMGGQSWLEAFRTNPEGRQHKVFALLLLGLGALELARATGKLRPPLEAWGFPALSVLGATLLFFHPHNVDDPSHAAPPAVEAKASEEPAPASSPHAGHDMAAHAGHGAAAPSTTTADPASRAAGDPAAAAKLDAAPAGGHGGHVMTETMLKVEKQHFWFSLVGFGIALFKFLYDARYWRRPFVPYLWPSFMSILGVLLIFYTE